RPEWFNKKFSGLVVSDLDGTLVSRNREVQPSVLRALESLGDRNILRVVATGRSLHSVRKLLPRNFPIDVLIFSCGAGTLCWKTGSLLKKHSLTETESAELAAFLLKRRDLCFMLHREIPENHHFLYFQTHSPPEDFVRRLDLNRSYAEELKAGWPAETRATQAIVIVRQTEASIYEELKSTLRNYSVIRTTSPLDHASIWIEVFPHDVSKGRTTNWLAEQLGVRSSFAMGMGNDYNDTDLLDWAGAAFVVSEAPETLKGRYRVVGSCEAGGAAQAIELWLRERFG
ncbi:MAG: HAD family phosphatase, partial [Bdellovibrionales bacterium]|nr:HAD family phosphatase [Bdellovibrionales bacterium]